jgi:glycosyltransferase involved in cell wall biosynthesis
MAGPELDKHDPAAGRYTVVPYRSTITRPHTLSWGLWDPAATKAIREIKKIAPDLIHVHMMLGLGRAMFSWIPSSNIPYVVSIHDYFLMCPRIYMIDYNGEVCRSVDLGKCASCVSLLDGIDVTRKLGGKLKVPLPRIRSNTVYRRAETTRALLTSARAVLPVSSRVREIADEFCPEAKFRVMHIGNDSASAQVFSKTASDKVRVVYLGTLSRIKGAEVLERLLRLVTRSDIEFHFFGRADREWCDRLSPLGLQIHGAYKPQQLGEILRQCDLGLVLPIWEDNGPQVAMEFVNYRIPVLGTTMGGVPDFVGSEGGMLFDPYSDDEVLKAAKWLDKVSLSDLEGISRTIRPLKTPQQHFTELDAVYREISASRQESE